MKFLAFLIRSAPRTFAASAVSGGLAGIAGAWVISLIYAQLSQGDPNRSLVWLFLGLCLFKSAAVLCSEVLLIRASQKTAHQLRMDLCRQILETPLREVESLGRHRLFPALTEDVATLTNSFREIPVCCISFFVVVGCLCYIGFLSAIILSTVLISAVVGIAIYHFVAIRALQTFLKTRELQDLLFKSYSALIEGKYSVEAQWRTKAILLSQSIDSASGVFSRSAECRNGSL